MLYMVFQAGMNIPITRESIYHALAQNNTPSAIKKNHMKNRFFYVKHRLFIWILFNIGYTVLLCLTAQAFIFWVRSDLIFLMN